MVIKSFVNKGNEGLVAYIGGNGREWVNGWSVDGGQPPIKEGVTWHGGIVFCFFKY
ncbi:hypothetical protein HanRHA438_Chr15g0710201 [Helianthus annuus]|nr:hypothetical protein HanRHA438_Chr15g0710201 [Helianthus annuus]